MNKTTEEIAGGAYHSRVHLRRRGARTDEIDELAANFDRMAEKVEEHLQSLRETNEKQRRLLGSLSHEMKTPLTAIIGYSETLMTVKLAEKNKIQALTYIHSEGKRLARLSEKMLELTGLYESAEHTLELQEIELRSFLKKLKRSDRFSVPEGRSADGNFLQAGDDTADRSGSDDEPFDESG
ncbi:MAG: histidine kinase dimerization/phospho-acceptor domain-containing protein [Lachnospiraceae bacterium]